MIRGIQPPRMQVARGFTLIELLVTLAILGLLSTAALPLAELGVRRSKEQGLRHALREIRSGLDAYKKASDEGRITRAADATGYPPTLEVLVDGVPNPRDPAKRPIYFLRRLPRDPFYTGNAIEPAQTWGLRSYASSPVDPQPGRDVFDVYSTSDQAGINGVPYRAW
jgi:general secretion pathway protein G